MQKKTILNSLPAINSILEACILVTLFTLPFSKTLVEICVTLAISVFVFKKAVVERNGVLKTPGIVLIGAGLYILFNALSLFNTDFMTLSLTAMVSKVIKWVLFLVVISETVDNEKAIRRVFITMLFSAGLILTDAFYQQYITGKDFLHYPEPYPVFKFHGRSQGATFFPTASFPFPNDFAAWINIVFFSLMGISFFDLKHEKRLKWTVFFLCAVLFFFLLITTASGAIMGFAVAMLFFLLFNLRKMLRTLIAAALIIIAVLSVSPYARTYFRESFVDVQQSVNDRFGMWDAGWKIYKQHPVIGNGVNTFFQEFKYFRDDEDKYLKGSYAHNCFLQMAADIGILGLLSFLFLSGAVLFSNIRLFARHIDKLTGAMGFGLVLGVGAFLIHSSVDTNLYSLNLAALFWLSLGIIQGAANSLKREEQK